MATEILSDCSKDEVECLFFRKAENGAFMKPIVQGFQNEKKYQEEILK